MADRHYNGSLTKRKSGVKGRGSKQRLRNRLRSSKRGSSNGKNEPSGPADLGGVCSDGKFVASGAGEAYDPRIRGPNRKFQIRDLTPRQQLQEVPSR